jgi:L-alanine-DL-glutamate epimerase-like enolase superfamily enzyme
MKIETVDFFYLAMPEIRDVGDGSQDVLLVRLRAGEWTGWGECEAAPLVSIAAWNCPMSHSACKPVSHSVLGQRLESVEDIGRIHRAVRENSLDLLQADHTLSGIDIAMWDLLARREGRPVHSLLGFREVFPKIAYASQLFGADAQETLRKAEKVRGLGYRAAKFGWGSFGRGTPEADAAHVRAAREGLGAKADLLIDAGTVWENDVARAELRLGAMEECRVRWLEEPFVSGALGAYRELAARCDQVKLAGGEGCHNSYQAINMIDYAGLGFIQIDAGRIGGITSAKVVADHAEAKGLIYVNHTFTTSLALSASIQPYAGLRRHDLCEFPVEPTPLARSLTTVALGPDANGEIRAPDAPGLGVTPDLDVVRRHLVKVDIEVGGKLLYRTPEI